MWMFKRTLLFKKFAGLRGLTGQTKVAGPPATDRTTRLQGQREPLIFERRGLKGRYRKLCSSAHGQWGGSGTCTRVGESFK